MPVRLSEAAEADLEEIGNFIAEDSPSRADSFAFELLDRCYGLATYPSRYPLVAERKGLQLRRCPHGSYLIFYSVTGDDLEIVRILHGARDYMQILFPNS